MISWSRKGGLIGSVTLCASGLDVGVRNLMLVYYVRLYGCIYLSTLCGELTQIDGLAMLGPFQYARAWMLAVAIL